MLNFLVFKEAVLQPTLQDCRPSPQATELCN